MSLMCVAPFHPILPDRALLLAQLCSATNLPAPFIVPAGPLLLAETDMLHVGD